MTYLDEWCKKFLHINQRYIIARGKSCINSYKFLFFSVYEISKIIFWKNSLIIFHKQIEKTLIRLLQELPDIGLLCLSLGGVNIGAPFFLSNRYNWNIVYRDSKQ